LRLLITRFDDMAPRLHEVLFDDGRCLAAYRALVERGGRVADALSHTDPASADLLQRLTVEDTDADPAEVAVRLVDAATRRELDLLGVQARTADDPLAYADLVRWVKLQLEALRDDHAAEGSAAQLLGWLLRRDEETA
jgi:hypothetical protein